MPSLTHRARRGVGARVRGVPVENPVARCARKGPKLEVSTPVGGDKSASAPEENPLCSLCACERDAPYGGLAPRFFSPEKRGS